MIALTLALTLTCPVDMAAIPESNACIDRYEAVVEDATAKSKKGVVPTTPISWKSASAACAKAGKRLCTRKEWTAACRGPGEKRKYAYGAKYEPRRCNDRARTQGKADAPMKTGGLPRCKTPEGVYDLSGNLWEWTADTITGETAYMLGGGWGNDDGDDNLSCVPEDTVAQPLSQEIVGLGFRCCKDQ
jgi:formylglycine-generating enzyme required for sulfatase activity